MKTVHTASALVAASSLVLWTTSVWACGGVFCAVPQGPTPPEPVDQNAERIIFEVDTDAGEIATHVQIEYAGDPDNFAWVVPVPGVPEVEDSNIALFEWLDSATRLTVIPPRALPCAAVDDGWSSPGCGCNDADIAPATADSGGSPVDASGPVTVYSSGQTNNYAFDVLGAERTSDLVAWLQDNGYNVSNNMTPVMDPYNSASMRFLAIKLLEGKGNNSIAPLKFTYAATEPMIPIQLTAVAAQPHMGILVFIVADEVFEPTNYGVVPPNSGEILVDGDYRTNYFDWVARTVDEAGGQLFVSEFIGRAPSRVGNPALQPGPIVARYYTRMSAHQMTVDPRFRRADSPSILLSNTLDLSNNTPLYACGQLITENLPSACAFNYCGLGATCVEQAETGRVACLCPENQVAQTVAGPDGDRVVCMPPTNPVGVTDEAAGVGGMFDPCGGFDCGEGQCVVKGGFPTCACDEGAGAVSQDSTVRCEMIASDSPQFGPGAGLESAPRVTRAFPLNQGWRRMVASLLPLLVFAGLLRSLGLVSRRA